MNKFLYAEVSASDFMLLPVSSIVSIDGASATSILIYYNNLEADDTDAGAAEKLPIITITVTSGELKHICTILQKQLTLQQKATLVLLI